MPALFTATPTKLRNGTWGARVNSEHVNAGDRLTVKARNGKVWTSTVERVLWTGDGKAIVATRGSGQHRTSRPTTRRRSDGFEHEDCLSFVGGCGPNCPYNFS